MFVAFVKKNLFWWPNLSSVLIYVYVSGTDIYKALNKIGTFSQT